jgi:glutaredoxin
MKQQCNISFVYGSWFIFLCGLIFYIVKGDYLLACFWVLFIALFLWFYIRNFSSLSRFMGYGSVEDTPAKNIQNVNTKVVFYTGVGCPFCPIVKRRLTELQHTMGFELKEIDITLRPEVLIKKGIRALPMIEVGESQWVGNATSDQLVTFITKNVQAG